MSNGGFVLFHRAIWETAMFTDEPLSKREAFVWLICEADYKGANRGMVVVSERHLAKAWQWDRFKVRRFLNALENDGMIKTSIKPESAPATAPANAPADALWTNRPATVVTVCKYDHYQRSVVKTQNGLSTGFAPANAPATAPDSKEDSSLRSESKKSARDFSKNWVRAKFNPYENSYDAAGYESRRRDRELRRQRGSDADRLDEAWEARRKSH